MKIAVRPSPDLEAYYSPWLPREPQAKILDLGCGRGRVLEFLRAKGFTDALGIDRDAGALAEAKARAALPVLHVTDLNAFLSDSPARFDLIIAKDVLYYFPRSEVPSVMAKLRQALRPGGRMIVEVFNGAVWTGPYILYKDLGIEWVPTEHSLRALLENAGLSVVDLRGVRRAGGGIRRRLFEAAGALWRLFLRLIYLVERGLDSQNPRHFEKKLVAVADRAGRGA